MERPSCVIAPEDYADVAFEYSAILHRDRTYMRLACGGLLEIRTPSPHPVLRHGDEPTSPEFFHRYVYQNATSAGDLYLLRHKEQFGTLLSLQAGYSDTKGVWVPNLYGCPTDPERATTLDEVDVLNLRRTMAYMEQEYAADILAMYEIDPHACAINHFSLLEA